MTERSICPIGLTGGIGTGKSTVSARLKELGAAVLDADAISRSLLMPDGACFSGAIELFGDAILRPDGLIDRAAVASIVFHNDGKLRALNELIHPKVLSEMELRAKKIRLSEPDRLIIYDVPLLYECGWEKKCRATILVTAPEEAVVDRVMKRDSVDRERVLQRIRAQMPEHKKRLLADYVIENDGTREALIIKVDGLYARLAGEGR